MTESLFSQLAKNHQERTATVNRLLVAYSCNDHWPNLRFIADEISSQLKTAQEAGDIAKLRELHGASHIVDIADVISHALQHKADGGIIGVTHRTENLLARAPARLESILWETKPAATEGTQAPERKPTSWLSPTAGSYITAALTCLSPLTDNLPKPEREPAAGCSVRA